MKPHIKDLLIGAVIAIAATLVGVIFYVEVFSPYSLQEFMAKKDEFNLFGKVFSLAALANLAVFFIFIRRKEDQKAKGVLLATIVLAIFLAMRQFL